MLLGFVIAYLLLSMGIGLVAALRVTTSKDFAVAGRGLPLPVVTATVFATWFGSEAVLGVSAQFAREGLQGVVADPFGSSMCLMLAGLFFAKRLYRLNLLTIGDYYKQRYNRGVEVLCTLCIVASYLGWVSAQIKALGLVFFIVTDGYVSQQHGMMLGAAIVLTYTTLAACCLWRCLISYRCRSSWSVCFTLPTSSAVWRGVQMWWCTTPSMQASWICFPKRGGNCGCRF